MLRIPEAVVCLLAISGISLVSGNPVVDCPPEGLISRNDTNGYRTLCIEIQTLRGVIPYNTLVAITTRHYQTDERFRHAMKFLQTAEFVEVSEQIEDSAVFQRLLTQFENAGVNTADIASISSILDCLLLPVPSYDMNYRSVSVAESRTLQSYAMDLMRAIPRQQFQRVLAESLANNPQFATFYRMVRNPGFEREVMRALGSHELSQPMRVLRRNYIDLRQLTSIVFRIFSWGPRPY